MSDWTMDLLFKPDVAMIKRFAKEQNENLEKYNDDSSNIPRRDKDNIQEITSQ
jgi:hypothetical protein